MSSQSHWRLVTWLALALALVVAFLILRLAHTQHSAPWVPAMLVALAAMGGSENAKCD